MTNIKKIKKLMATESLIQLENGVVLEKSTKFNAIIVMKVKDLEVQWIENFENLPEKGKKLIEKMLKARKVMLSFDTEFNILTNGIVISNKSK